MPIAERVFDPLRDVFNHHRPAWSKALERWVDKPNVQGLEIGSFEGMSACWLCDHVLTGVGAQLTCVDPWNSAWSGEKEEGRFDANTAGLPVEKIKGFSREVLPCMVVANRSFDVIYIDGDHRASEVLWDVVLCWELLARGGVVILDDYLWTDRSVKIPPRAAIDGFVASCGDQIRHVAHSKCGQVFLWK